MFHVAFLKDDWKMFIIWLIKSKLLFLKNDYHLLFNLIILFNLYIFLSLLSNVLNVFSCSEGFLPQSHGNKRFQLDSKDILINVVIIGLTYVNAHLVVLILVLITLLLLLVLIVMRLLISFHFLLLLIVSRLFAFKTVYLFTSYQFV
jgi:hypothetical protein